MKRDTEHKLMGNVISRIAALPLEVKVVTHISKFEDYVFRL